MGYKITQQSNSIAHDVYEVVVETPADLATIPPYVGAGSTGIVLKNEEGAPEVRIKSPSGDWVVI